MQPDETPIIGGLCALGEALEAGPVEPSLEECRAAIYRAHELGQIDTAELIRLTATVAAERRQRMVDAMTARAPAAPAEPTWQEWPTGKVFIANDSTVVGPATPAAYHDGPSTKQ